MIVSDLRAYTAEGVARIDARVEWEDCDEAPLDVFVETVEDASAYLAADPNALLAACVLPAWRAGETRIRVGGSLCPALVERVKTPLGMLQSWFPGDFGPPPRIEPDAGWEVRTPVDGQSLQLLSCGIDSLATLRWNTLNVPRSHRDAITACVYYEFDRDEQPSLERLLEATGPRADVVTAVTGDVRVEAIPVRTNLWWLADDGDFFTKKWHGAFLASLLACFGGRFRRGYVASSHSPSVVQPYGSHPLLDPYFGSAHFEIEHDLFSMHRNDKIALVAEWPAGVANIRVCQNDNSGRPNCGTCEKCIRTQVQLAAIGRLEAAAPAFPYTTLSRELVRTIDEYDMIRGHPYFIGWYTDALPGLRAHGYGDVADAVALVLESATSESA